MKSNNQKRAAEIAKAHKVKTVYENSKGEFFLSPNLAELSEGGNKENVYEHTFSGKPATEDKEADEAKESQKVISKIEKAKTSDAVDELLIDVTNQSVLKAGADRKLELEMEATDALVKKINSAKTVEAVEAVDKLLVDVTDADVLKAGEEKKEALLKK